MRQIVFISALLLSIAAPSLAQEQLIVGNSYSGNVKLSSPNNAMYLTLLEGQWTLASLEKTRNNPILSGDYVPIIKGRFVRTDEKNRIIGIISFESGNGSEAGWTTPAFCSRKDTFFLQTEIQNRGAREKKCWGIYPGSLGTPAATASQYIKDFYQYAALNKLIKPLSIIAVQFYRSNSSKYLHAYYYFNPEIEGFPRSGMSTWQKDVVIADAKRVQYLNAKKAWGEQWLSTFETAFAGRVKQQCMSPVSRKNTAAS